MDEIFIPPMSKVGPAETGGEELFVPPMGQTLQEGKPLPIEPEKPKERGAPVLARGQTKPDEPELTLGQALRGARQNLVPSTVNVFKGIAHAVTNPVETAEALGKVGTGLWSKAKGAVGVEQDPAQKAQDEAVVNAIGDHYGDTYGSWKGFKKGLATDPASVAMDVSMPLTLVPSGGSSLGLSAATTAGKAATLATKAVHQTGRLLNPVDDAVRLAGLVGSKAVMPVARFGQWSATGVSPGLLKLAQTAGETKNPALRDTFVRFAGGTGSAEELFSATQGAFNKVKEAHSAAYAKTKAGQQAMATTPDYAPIDAAITKARQDISFNGRRDPAAWKNANNVLDEIEGLVDRHRLDPRAQNYVDFDKLRDAIYDLGAPYKHGGDKAYNTMMGVYDGVKQSIKNVSPEYQKLMDQWQEARIAMNNLRTTLGQGNNIAASSSLARMLRAFKTKGGRDMIAELAQHDPTIPYMLAGSAISPWMRPGAIGDLSRFGGMAAMIADPTLLPHVLTGVAASSPRAAGMINYGAGRLGSKVGQVLSPQATYGLHAASLANEAAANPAPLMGSQFANMQGPDAVFDRMIQAESRGQHTDAKGNVRVSPKGAIGLTQVMPGTGPEAAKLAGEEWSLNRLRTDEKYNLKLGRAYFDAMHERYGDPMLAAAAYNTGPANVDRAIEKAKKHGGDWRTYLPKQETRDYLIKVFGGERPTRASGGRVGNHAAKARALVAAAERSKKSLGASTSALLNEHDDAITKALATANQAI